MHANVTLAPLPACHANRDVTVMNGPWTSHSLTWSDGCSSSYEPLSWNFPFRSAPQPRIFPTCPETMFLVHHFSPGQRSTYRHRGTRQLTKGLVKLTADHPWDSFNPCRRPTLPHLVQTWRPQVRPYGCNRHIAGLRCPSGLPQSIRSQAAPLPAAKESVRWKRRFRRLRGLNHHDQWTTCLGPWNATTVRTPRTFPTKWKPPWRHSPL